MIGGSQISANSTMDFAGSGWPGTKVGDKIIAQPSGPLDSTWNGILWTAWVSGTEEVTVRLANITGSPITPTAVPFVFKRLTESASGY